MRLRLLVLTLSLWSSLGSSVAFCQTSEEHLAEGKAAYKTLELTKAIQHLRAFLKDPQQPSAKRAQALSYLAICHYNLDQTKAASQAWKRALKLNPKQALPPGQAPEATKFFEKLRPRPRVTRREVPRRRVPQRRILAAMRRPPPRRAAAATPSFVQRHTISIVLLSVGVAATATAGVFGGMAANQTAQMYQQTNDPQSSYQSAQTNATISTALWIAGGTLAAGAVTLFFLGK